MHCWHSSYLHSQCGCITTYTLEPLEKRVKIGKLYQLNERAGDWKRWEKKHGRARIQNSSGFWICDIFFFHRFYVLLPFSFINQCEQKRRDCYYWSTSLIGLLERWADLAKKNPFSKSLLNSLETRFLISTIYTHVNVRALW